MENNEFLQLLKTFGFVPPASEQESFWRIPSNLATRQLEINLELLNKELQDGDDDNISYQNNEKNEAREINSPESKHNDDDTQEEAEDEISQVDEVMWKEDSKSQLANEFRRYLDSVESDEELELPRKKFKGRIIESDEDE
ncbi:protein timeless homolog [Centruroides sculpturatus]|uniref:protein timeless homolog n=1 Tax=Centruroides sculpturatus TaxID=218467 RepID=UPI000C6D6957|nr:protein timeless homolog [Centruroides sculpturatus]